LVLSFRCPIGETKEQKDQEGIKSETRIHETSLKWNATPKTKNKAQD
jgi:hypothetical protein